MDIDLVNLGKRMRSIRLKMGMTVEELAEKTKLSFTMIAQMERGEKKGSIESLVAISNILGVSIEDLLTDSLLFTNGEGKTKHEEDLSYILLDCNENEARLIIKNAENLKTLLKKYK